MAERDFDVLLLDFGGVCILNPVELHGRGEEVLGLEPGTLTWMGPVDPSTDELWRHMIAGELTERDYWTRRADDVGRLAGRELSRTEYMRILYEPPGPHLVRPEATAVVAAARDAGYGVSVLTNDMRAFHGREWEKGIALLDQMDHVIDCSDQEFLKPDPRAFELAREATGVPAARMLFVDDQPLNVEGAVEAGLHGMWFDVANAAEAWAEVAALLGFDGQ